MIHYWAAHIHFQWTFSTWKEEKSCSPGTMKIFVPTGRELNSQPSEYYMFIGRSNHWTGGLRVRFLPGAWKFPLSRASMVSPPSKLKMFTGSVCVLLTSVSLKLIKIKIKLIYATTSLWEKKRNGGWKLSDTDWFYFSFYNSSCFFFYYPTWSESSFMLFLFFYSIWVGPSRSELIWPGLAVRVDPVQLLYLPVLQFVLVLYF